MPFPRLTLAVAAFALTGTAAVAATSETKDQKIRPRTIRRAASVTAHATVADMDDKGKTTVLRKGANGWTCPHWMSMLAGREEQRSPDDAAR